VLGCANDPVPERDRATRIRPLQSTLFAFTRWLELNDATLDGNLITGEVTTRARQEGFDELPGLLAALEPSSEAGNIVVAPRNHDVTRSNAPGNAERYAALTY
jgi:hypothetical protein